MPKIDRTSLIFLRPRVSFTRNHDFKMPVYLVPGKDVLAKKIKKQKNTLKFQYILSGIVEV